MTPKASRPRPRASSPPRGNAAPAISSGICSPTSRPDQHGLVAAALRELFNAGHRDQARERITHVIARLEPVAPKVSRLLEDAEEDLIAF
jgi:hypothetical protein